MRAAVDRGLMFRNHERALGKVEHLALLDPDRRLRFERPTAMAAAARLMPNHMIGGSAACRNVPPWWPFCPPLALPERPRRLPAIRGFFFNPSLEGGLGHAITKKEAVQMGLLTPDEQPERPATLVALRRESPVLRLRRWLRIPWRRRRVTATRGHAVARGSSRLGAVASRRTPGLAANV